MEDFSFEQLLMQALIHRKQIVLRGPQNPVGHGLPVQLNPPAVQLLFLPVQRRTHNKLLHHDVRNSFRSGKAAGDNILLPGCFHNGRLDILPVAVRAGVGVVNILPDDILGRDDLQRLYDFLANLRHGIPELRTDQVLTLQTMLRLFRGDSFRDGIQCVGMLLMPLVGSHNSDRIVLRLFPDIHLRLVKQEFIVLTIFQVHPSFDQFASPIHAGWS